MVGTWCRPSLRQTADAIFSEIIKVSFTPKGLIVKLYALTANATALTARITRWSGGWPLSPFRSTALSIHFSYIDQMYSPAYRVELPKPRWLSTMSPTWASFFRCSHIHAPNLLLLLICFSVRSLLLQRKPARHTHQTRESVGAKAP